MCLSPRGRLEQSLYLRVEIFGNYESCLTPIGSDEACHRVVGQVHSIIALVNEDRCRCVGCCVGNGISRSDKRLEAASLAAGTVSVCSRRLSGRRWDPVSRDRSSSARARRFKQQFGGGFRQAGIIAAGAFTRWDIIPPDWVRSTSTLRTLRARSLHIPKSTSVWQRLRRTSAPSLEGSPCRPIR